MDEKTRTDMWNQVYAASCATQPPGEAAKRATDAIQFAEQREAEMQALGAAERAKIQMRGAAGMEEIPEQLFAIRLDAWQATLAEPIPPQRRGHALHAAWAALADEERNRVDAREGWPGGTHAHRLALEQREHSGMSDVPMDVWHLRWRAWIVDHGSDADPVAFGRAWRELAPHQQLAIETAGYAWGGLWKTAATLPPVLPDGVLPAPGIFTVWEAVSGRDEQGVGVFARAEAAQRAVKGLRDRPTIRPVRVLTLDGHYGWQMPREDDGLTHTAPIHHDIDAYLRNRARAALTEDERAVLLAAALPERCRASEDPPVGMVTLHQAERPRSGGIGESDFVWASAGLFFRAEDAARAAHGPLGEGRVTSVDALTLDGLTAWLGETQFEPIHHDIIVYLRARALSKLTREERHAHGLPEAASA